MAVKTCTAFNELSINRKISERALELLKQFYLSNGLKFLDALIAATALENKLILITGNLKHFNFIEGLTIASQEKYL